MNIIKILFTGVGRRVELIQSFRQAAYKENIELKIYGADISSTKDYATYEIRRVY